MLQSDDSFFVALRLSSFASPPQFGSAALACHAAKTPGKEEAVTIIGLERFAHVFCKRYV